MNSISTCQQIAVNFLQKSLRQCYSSHNTSCICSILQKTLTILLIAEYYAYTFVLNEFCLNMPTNCNQLFTKNPYGSVIHHINHHLYVPFGKKTGITLLIAEYYVT